jgi:hypothetical protein
MSRLRPRVVVAVLLAGALALLGGELLGGALDYGASTAREPCGGRPPHPGGGVDATVQRIVLSGLDGAACELGTTREELVLSLSPRTGRSIRWDDATIERAVRSGLRRAVDDAEARGSIGGTEAGILRGAIDHLPIRLLLEGGGSLRDLLERVLP